MSDLNVFTIQLTIPGKLRDALQLAARNKGCELAEEALARIQASFPAQLGGSTITDTDMLAVTSKVALMAGRRGTTKQMDARQRSVRETEK